MLIKKFEVELALLSGVSIVSVERYLSQGR
jgi:hypothetical protein